MYGDVRHRTSTQDTADAKFYGTHRCCQWAQLRCRPSVTCGMLLPLPYGDAVCVNAAVEINVLNYNVAVRRRT